MPALLMIALMVLLSIMNMLYKLTINDGMNLKVLVALRFTWATICLTPVAYVFERKKRSRLTRLIMFQAFLSGLFGGSLAQNLYVASVSLTSASFATAMTNIIPTITFILAVMFRLELLAMRTTAGKAKVMGTLIGLGGAMLLTFYKGVEITPWKSSLDLLHHHRDGHNTTTTVGVHPESGSHATGSLLSVGCCISYAIWTIVQAKLMRSYPYPLSAAMLMCFMASVQALIFALCGDRDRGGWRVGFDIRLLTVIYTGLAATAVTLPGMSWCIRKKGPLYSMMFNPLMLVIVSVLGSVFLEEKLHLGSIFGAVMIIISLYMVLWGKGREQMLSVSMQAGSCTLTESETSSISESVIALDETI
ncbi:WAT1-related protein [Acorus calamus]|uniref:WAT1-related protein n=1 Tax=Acorus calamus TaxID=4465 RepID=A0AAV9DHY9_ACOCL|nr:WAT1-related protein [Acorus calamus]